MLSANNSIPGVICFLIRGEQKTVTFHLFHRENVPRPCMEQIQEQFYTLNTRLICIKAIKRPKKCGMLSVVVSCLSWEKPAVCFSHLSKLHKSQLEVCHHTRHLFCNDLIEKASFTLYLPIKYFSGQINFSNKIDYNDNH